MALIGISSMLPVSRCDPAISTSTRPSVNAAPVNRVGRLPQIFGSSPDDTVMATSPPKAM
jgi:hypothetical protein